MNEYDSIQLIENLLLRRLLIDSRLRCGSEKVTFIHLWATKIFSSPYYVASRPTRNVALRLLGHEISSHTTLCSLYRAPFDLIALPSSSSLSLSSQLAVPYALIKCFSSLRSINTQWHHCDSLQCLSYSYASGLKRNSSMFQRNSGWVILILQGFLHTLVFSALDDVCCVTEANKSSLDKSNSF